MDSGNVKAPAGLHSLITGNRGGSENQSGEQKSGEGGGFAGLIAAILSNAKAPKEQGASANVPNGQGGTAANASAGAATPAQSGIAQPPSGAGAFLLRVVNNEAAAGQNAQTAQQGAGKAAAPAGAGAALEKLITTTAPAAGAPAPNLATAAKAAQPASAAGAEGKAAATIATASTGGSASPADNSPSANAAAANTGHTGHVAQKTSGQGPAGPPREMLTPGAGANDAVVESKAPPAGQTAAGVDAPVKGAEASATPKAAAQQGAGPQSIVQQVAQNLTVIAGNGVDRLRFQLHPAELGQVSVQLSIRAGATRVVIAAEHPAALEAMRHAAGSLQQALQNAGLNVEREGLQFDLQSQDQPQQQHADADVNRRKERGDADERDGSRPSDDAASKSSEPQRRASDGLFI